VSQTIYLNNRDRNRSQQRHSGDQRRLACVERDQRHRLRHIARGRRNAARIRSSTGDRLYGNDTLAIHGNNAVIDGANAHGGIVARSGTVTIDNLTLFETSRPAARDQASSLPKQVAARDSVAVC